jgi:Putative zinc-finger
VNCTTVRDRLAEHALGALPFREADPVDRHLTWCAACRKEAGELQRASASLGFALAPGDPSPELEGSIVDAVHAAVARRDRRPHTNARRSRLTLVAALAAMLAVLGTGWGAVMAGRAARSDEAAKREIIKSQSAIERFRAVINTLEFGQAEDQAFIATLSPTTSGGGGGSALTLVSPSITDMAVVLVNGVPPETQESLPFTVRLRGDDGVLMVGRIDKGGLDEDGAGIVMREALDLSGFDTVIVRDAHGRVVMHGAMETRATVASPTP